MDMPFSIESYIKKARKDGYSVAQIKSVLTLNKLWNKVIGEGKPFKKTFEYYLEAARDGNLEQQSIQPQREMKTIFKKRNGRLI